MSLVQMNPQMKLAEANSIVRAYGFRLKLLKVDSHANRAFTAVDNGNHEEALQHLRTASAALDEAEKIRCAA